MSFIYTIDDILDPFGRGVAVYYKKLILDSFEARYNNIKHKIKYGINVTKDVFTLHYKVPSENQLSPDFYYDVIFEFSTDNPEYIKYDSLTYYDVRVYSTSPSFVFRFCYVWNKTNSLVQWALKKCIRDALIKPPLTTNPQMILGFEKSLWYAAKHMQKSGLLNKSHLAKQKQVSLSAMNNNTLSQEETIKILLVTQKRNREKNKISKSKNVYDPMRDKLAKKYKDDPEKLQKIRNVTSKPSKSNFKTQVKQTAKRPARMAKKPTQSKSARQVKKPR